MRPAGRQVVLACSLVAALSACGSGDNASKPPSTATPQAADDAFIAIDHAVEDAYWETALIKGQLQEQDSCLTITRGSRTLVTVWPSDYTWDPDSETVSWTAGEGWEPGSARVGDKVTFAGGVEPREDWQTQNTDADNQPLLSPQVIAQIQECLDRTGAESWTFVHPA